MAPSETPARRQRYAGGSAYPFTNAALPLRLCAVRSAPLINDAASAIILAVTELELLQQHHKIEHTPTTQHTPSMHYTDRPRGLPPPAPTLTPPSPSPLPPLPRPPPPLPQPPRLTGVLRALTTEHGAAFDVDQAFLLRRAALQAKGEALGGQGPWEGGASSQTLQQRLIGEKGARGEGRERWGIGEGWGGFGAERWG